MRHIAVLLAVTCIMGSFAPVGAAPDELKNPALNPVTVRDVDLDEPVVLVRDGKPAATIVVAGEGPAVDSGRRWQKIGVTRLAARELQQHVEKATGARLPIVKDADKVEGAAIVLMATAPKDTPKGVMPAAEGFRVITEPGRLVIHGSPADVGRERDRGVLFGVYDVLERFVGVRWYYPTDEGTVIPSLETVSVPSVQYTDAPHYARRTMWPWQVVGKAKYFPGNTDYDLHGYRYREGSHTDFKTGCHTPKNFQHYREQYPECFEQYEDGHRAKNMPCYGHPKSVEMHIRIYQDFFNGDTRGFRHGKGLWGTPDEHTIVFSPPDRGIRCRCEHCASLGKWDTPHRGQASPILGRFVAKFAREAKKRWPEKKVVFLPYSNYLDFPEGVDFPDNVVPFICLTRGEGTMKEDYIMEYHNKVIDDWVEGTGNKAVLWEYLCWPGRDTALPFQYPHTLQTFHRRNKDKVVGCFINGDSGPPGLPGKQWAFQHWTLYCWFRLYWNPDFDVDAALDEYLRLMYGPAEAPMREIYAMLIDRWENVHWSREISGHNVPPKFVHEETMPRKEALKLKELLARARELAGQKTLARTRVEFFGAALERFFEESDRYHEGTGLAKLKVLKVNDQPTIDGKLDDACWTKAPKGDFVRAMDKENPKPENPTTVQMVWTDKGVTFGFRMSEKKADDLRGDTTQRDLGHVWNEDSMELFLDVEGERVNRYQIIVNYLNTQFDRYEKKGGWDADGMKSGVHVGDDYWSLEIYIPFVDFVNGATPTPGQVWYGNFVRNRRAGGARSAQRWSTSYQAKHKDFTAFGRMTFVEELE